MSNSSLFRTTLVTPTLAIAALLAATFSSATAMAATLTLPPTADAFIRTGQTIVTTKNTTNVVMLVGTAQTAKDNMRGLLAFDLTNPALVGAKINNVTLTLKVNAADTGSEKADVALNLYPVKNTFSEGAVSWAYRNSANYWTTQGGDYGDLLASATANAGTVSPKQAVTFTDAKLTASVASLIGSPFSLLVKLAKEDTGQRSIFRFGTINGAPALQPVLTIDYTPAAK